MNLDIIKNIEKELNTELKKVELSEITEYRYETKAKYSLSKNSEINGLFICGFDLKEISNLIYENNKLKNSLTHLNFGFNQISELSNLKEFTELEELYLWNNQILDISVLQYLTKIKKLNFDCRVLNSRKNK